MKLSNLLFCFIAFISLNGCSTLSVNYDYKQSADFSNYKKYSWLPFPKDTQTSQLNQSRFIAAVNTSLASKGFTENTSNADFMIATHIASQEKVDITGWGYSYAPVGSYYGYGYRHGGASLIALSGGMSVYQYEEGTLILDFIDAKTKELIWRATAKAIVNPASTPAKQTEKINNAVQEILKEFPPTTKK